MKVEDWLALHGSSKAWLARQLGINPGRLYSYLSGAARVPLYVVQQTHRLSRGKVSLWDWSAAPLDRGSSSTQMSDPPPGEEVEQGTRVDCGAGEVNTRARS